MGIEQCLQKQYLRSFQVFFNFVATNVTKLCFHLMVYLEESAYYKCSSKKLYL